VSDERGVRNLRWQPHFRHSAGKLGSHFIRAVREGKLVGWKTQSLGVTVPPIGTGEAGEWVEVGPRAALVTYAPNDNAGGGIPAGKFFATVRIDGADVVTAALVECDETAGLTPGAVLTAKFATSDDAATLPIFELVANP